MRFAVDIDAGRRDVELPKEGEVWLCLESGYLYEMGAMRGGEPWRHCHRIGAPEQYGCDPTVDCACWDSAVREGRWIRVLNCPPHVGEGKGE